MLQAVLSTMLEEIQGEARQRIEQHKSQVRPLLCCQAVLWRLAAHDMLYKTCSAPGDSNLCQRGLAQRPVIIKDAPS